MERIESGHFSLDRPVCLGYSKDVKTARTDSDAGKRILETACDLFYRNGYRATGINEIIEKSGVAKATFYANYPSKESLAVAYVKARNEEENRDAAEAIRKFRGPYEKLLGLLEFASAWTKERNYRGCTYLNIASEIPDYTNPVRRESKNHYDTVRVLVGQLMKELKAERGDAWKGRDAERLADDYLLIFAGAMAMAPLYHDQQPFRDAISSAKRLLE
jgi:AcrR family transcriptional regulator